MTRDRDILRALAGRLRHAADAPEMARRRQLWRAHNALRPAKPMILCFPEGSWDELVSDRDCRCRDPQLRRWELTLRRRIFACEQIGDDQPVEPYFDLNWRVEVSDFGVNIPRVEGDNRGSFVWDPLIKDLERDFAKLRPRTFRVDREATQRDLERADAMFGDLLTELVRDPAGGNSFVFNLWGPGRTAKVQCDACSTFGPAAFRRFVKPALTQQCQWLDYSMFHLDGESCLPSLDEILDIEPLDAVEWTPSKLSVGDSGGNPRWHELYRRILAAGKSVQAIGVRPEEVIPLLDACGPEGMFITCAAASEAEAGELLERVEAYR